MGGHGHPCAPLLPAEFGRCPAVMGRGLASASVTQQKAPRWGRCLLLTFTNTCENVESACSASVMLSWYGSTAPKATWADKSWLWHRFPSGVQAELQMQEAGWAWKRVLQLGTSWLLWVQPWWAWELRPQLQRHDNWSLTSFPHSEKRLQSAMEGPSRHDAQQTRLVTSAWADTGQGTAFYVLPAISDK